MRAYLEVEMPDRCKNCQFFLDSILHGSHIDHYCYYNGMRIWNHDYLQRRSPDCPLNTLEQINREAEEWEAGLRREEARKTGEEVVGAIKAWVDEEPERPNVKLRDFPERPWD